MRALSLGYFLISGVLALTSLVVLFLNFYVAVYALDPANDLRYLRAAVIMIGGSAAIVLSPASFFIAARRIRLKATASAVVLPWLALGVYPVLMSIVTFQPVSAG